MNMAREVRVDPVDVAIDMLKERLPGFSHKIEPSRMAVRIQGALPIATEVSIDSMLFPVPMIDPPMSSLSMAILDALESDEKRAIRLAIEKDRQTTYIKRIVEPFVNHIVENIQEFGIDALNLEPVIEEKIRIATERAARQARQEGLEEGRKEGRKEMLKELLESANIMPSDLMNLED